MAFLRKSAFVVAIRGKANVAFCSAYVCFTAESLVKLSVAVKTPRDNECPQLPNLSELP